MDETPVWLRDLGSDSTAHLHQPLGGVVAGACKISSINTTHTSLLPLRCKPAHQGRPLRCCACLHVLTDAPLLKTSSTLLRSLGRSGELPQLSVPPHSCCIRFRPQFSPCLLLPSADSISISVPSVNLEMTREALS
eukprot:m.802773 g.802773  ORF g.802773 m.802773 type:complete len:136 (-) comp59275_c0_seq26:145-552(-)